MWLQYGCWFYSKNRGYLHYQWFLKMVGEELRFFTNSTSLAYHHQYHIKTKNLLQPLRLQENYVKL